MKWGEEVGGGVSMPDSSSFMEENQQILFKDNFGSRNRSMSFKIIMIATRASKNRNYLRVGAS